MYTLVIREKDTAHTETTFYNPISEDPRFLITEGSFNQEINGAGQLTFTIPYMNVKYDKFKPFETLVYLLVDGIEYWRGRVISTEVDYYRNKTVTCEGILNYLLDSYVPPYKIVPEGSEQSYIEVNLRTWFNWLITSHDSQVGDSTETTHTYHQFYVVSSELASDWGSETIKMGDSDDYPKILDFIMDNMVEQKGGYLYARYETINGVTGHYIHYRKYLNKTSAQFIAFDENLIDYVDTVADDEFWTALIPLGKSVDDGSGTGNSRVTINVNGKNYITVENLVNRGVTTTPLSNGATATSILVNGSSVTVNKWDVAQYGGKYYVFDEDGKWYMKALNFNDVKEHGMIYHIETFDDVNDAAALLDEAKKALIEHQSLQHSFTVKAIDMRLYRGDYTSLKVGQIVKVMSPPHGLSDNLLLSSVSIDLLNPSNNEYTFGDPDSTLTKAQAKAYKTLMSTRKNAQAASSSAKEAKIAAKNAQETVDGLELTLVDGEDETAELKRTGGGSSGSGSSGTISDFWSDLDPASADTEGE